MGKRGYLGKAALPHAALGARVSSPHAGWSPEIVALYAAAREAPDARRWDLVSRTILLAEQETAKAEHAVFRAAR